MTSDVLPSQSGKRCAGASGAIERLSFHIELPEFASNDVDPEELATAIEAECWFEIFRSDEERMTSILFSGGDWRWRLVTAEGVLLAEATGYPNEGLCRAAVLILKRRAATAPITRPGESV